MPPKESLFSTLRKTVVFFRLTRTYLRDAALATRARRRLDGVSRGGRPAMVLMLSGHGKAHLRRRHRDAQGLYDYG